MRDAWCKLHGTSPDELKEEELKKQELYFMEDFYSYNFRA